MATAIQFCDGDTLSIAADEAGPRLWSVVSRKRGGYLLRPLGLGDARLWQDEEIVDLYCRRKITHYPFDVGGMPRKYAEIVDRAWEAWPAEVRCAAERRLLYVQAVDEARSHSPTAHDAYAAAAQLVFNTHRTEWELEDTSLLAERESRRRRIGTRPDGVLQVEIRPPSPFTVRSWYIPWVRHGRDLRILLPHHHRKGNRLPRAQRATEGGVDPYKLMDEVIEGTYMVMPRKSIKVAYRVYERLCSSNNVDKLSSTTFRKRIHSQYTAREEYRF